MVFVQCSARATAPRACRTAPRSAACTPPSTPCSTGTRCTTARPYVFYMDIRAGGQGLRRVRRAGPSRRTAPSYIRGRVSRIYAARTASWWCTGPTRCRARPVEISADMVVLATAVRAAGRASSSWPRSFGVSYDPDGFFDRGPPQAAPGGDQHRRHLPGRRLPGAPGHPRDRGPGQRARPPRCSACSAATSSTREPVGRAWSTEPHLLDCRAASCARAPAPTRPSSSEEIKRPGRHASADRRQGQPGPLPGLRHLRGHLPHQGASTSRASPTSRSTPRSTLWTTGDDHGHRSLFEPQDHRLRLQLVHLRRRRPRRHQPHQMASQRARDAPALHRPHRPRSSCSRPSSAAPTA